MNLIVYNTDDFLFNALWRLFSLETLPNGTVSVSFLQKKMKRFNKNNCLLKQYRQCHNRQFYSYLWQSKPIFKAKSLRLPHPLTYKCKL